MKVGIFKIGRVSRYQLIHLTPVLLSTWDFTPFKEHHYFTIQLIWLGYGCGLKIQIVNKNVVDPPDLNELF